MYKTTITILCLILVCPITACGSLDYDSFYGFVRADTTNEHEYIWGGVDTYICVHFATDLARNLTDVGYDVGVVTKTAKYHGDMGHMLTWVKIDGSIFVVESMNDYIMFSDDYNATIDQDRYITRYESLESGERKANEMYQRLM